MKISNKNTMVQLEAYLKQARQQHVNEEQQPARQATVRTDKVDLSDKAREVKKARQMLKQMPDVREKEVRQVKASVEDGSYKVDGKRVAGAMLQESFENDMILKKIDLRV